MKFLILICGFLLLVNTVSADVVMDSQILSDTVWLQENGVHIVNGELSVATGTTLTISPGTIVKFREGQGRLVVEGSLVAQSSGTTSPIVFTSYRDDEFGGDTNGDATSTTPQSRDWLGITFSPGSSGVLDNTKIKYGGYYVYYYNNDSGLINNTGNVSVKNSEIYQNGTFGFRNSSGEFSLENSIIDSSFSGSNTESGTTTMVGNIIRNNPGEGIRSTINGQLTLNNNQFINNGRTGTIGAGVRFIHEGNTSSDVTNRGFFMPGNPLDGFVFHSNDLPIILYGGYMNIVEGVSVTFAPGTVVKMDFLGDLWVSGNLNMQGSSSNPVIITSIKDDSVMGDTNGDGNLSSPDVFNTSGIKFFASSTANISHTVFKNVRIGLTNEGGDLSLESVKIDNSVQTGIYHRSGELQVNNSEILSINGLISESLDKVDATNNWWGNSSGPRDAGTSTPSGTGSLVSGNINYTPWIARDPSLPNPVIIIPGIMGSYLYKESDPDEEVWMNLSKMLFPGDDEYLKDLALSESGESLYKFNYPDIIRETGLLIFKRDNFEGLIQSLLNNGFEENESLFVFPYDWRMDISEIAESLKHKMDEVKLKTGAQEVDIVAHSMGGLIIKEYLMTFAGNSVNKFINIGTPHTGSPKTFVSIISGYTDIGILNMETIKYISQNMPSVYQLLPSQNYFGGSENYYVFDGINGNKRLTYEDTKRYLKDSGRNASLVDRANDFHQEIDSLDPADYGVETYNIVGCGEPTLGQIFILDKKDDEYYYAIKMIDGDGTVPIRSAEAMSATKTYYAKDVKHATMSSASGVKELVVSLLNKDNNASLSSNVSESPDFCGIPDGQLVSFHSPITLDVYDSFGNHAGPNADGDIENNIEGVVYEVIENNKFAYLPSGKNYIVKGQATSDGSFDVRVEDIKGGEVTSTTLFSDIPLTLSTKVEMIMDGDIPSGVLIDKDGDNSFEDIKAVSTTTIGFLESSGKIKTIEQKPVDSPVTPNRSRSTINLAKTENPIMTVPNQTEQRAVNEEKAMVEKYSKIEVVTFPDFVTKAETSASKNNQASVWSGFSNNIQLIFKRWWEWFKNKLL